jgi:hypothetical protein
MCNKSSLVQLQDSKKCEIEVVFKKKM